MGTWIQILGCCKELGVVTGTCVRNIKYESFPSDTINLVFTIKNSNILSPPAYKHFHANVFIPHPPTYLVKLLFAKKPLLLSRILWPRAVTIFPWEQRALSALLFPVSQLSKTERLVGPQPMAERQSQWARVKKKMHFLSLCGSVSLSTFSWSRVKFGSLFLSLITLALWGVRESSSEWVHWLAFRYSEKPCLQGSKEFERLRVRAECQMSSLAFAIASTGTHAYARTHTYIHAHIPHRQTDTLSQ